MALDRRGFPDFAVAVAGALGGDKTWLLEVVIVYYAISSGRLGVAPCCPYKILG